MGSGSLQVFVGRAGRGKVPEAFTTSPRELVEQRAERLLAPAPDAPFAIEGRERLAAEYGAHARDPEVMLGFDEMRHDLARAPGSLAVVVVEPGAGKAGQLNPENFGGPFQDGQRFSEREIGHVTSGCGFQ